VIARERQPGQTWGELKGGTEWSKHQTVGASVTAKKKVRLYVWVRSQQAKRSKGGENDVAIRVCPPGNLKKKKYGESDDNNALGG